MNGGTEITEITEITEEEIPTLRAQFTKSQEFETSACGFLLSFLCDLRDLCVSKALSTRSAESV
jgi:hypothetical protein